MQISFRLLALSARKLSGEISSMGRYNMTNVLTTVVSIGYLMIISAWHGLPKHHWSNVSNVIDCSRQMKRSVDYLRYCGTKKNMYPEQLKTHSLSGCAKQVQLCTVDKCGVLDPMTRVYCEGCDQAFCLK